LLTRKDLKINFEDLGYLSSPHAMEKYLYPNMDSVEILVHRVISFNPKFNVCAGNGVQAAIVYAYSYEFYKHERELLDKIYEVSSGDESSDFARKAAAFSAATKRYYSSIILKALLSIREAGIDTTPDFAYQVAKIQLGRGISTRITKAVFGDNNRSRGQRRIDARADELHNDERAIKILNKAKLDLAEAKKKVSLSSRGRNKRSA